MKLTATLKNAAEFTALLRASSLMGQGWLLLFSPTTIWLSIDPAEQQQVQIWSSCSCETYLTNIVIRSRVSNFIGLRLNIGVLASAVGAVCPKGGSPAQLSLRYSDELDCPVLRLSAITGSSCVVSEEVPVSVLGEGELGQVRVPSAVRKAPFDLFLPQPKGIEAACTALSQLGRTTRVTLFRDGILGGVQASQHTREADPLLGDHLLAPAESMEDSDSLEATGLMSLTLVSPTTQFGIRFSHLDVSMRSQTGSNNKDSTQEIKESDKSALSLEIQTKTLMLVSKYISRFSTVAVSIVPKRFCVFSIVHDNAGSSTYILIPRVATRGD